jgi:hypothetical protein
MTDRMPADGFLTIDHVTALRLIREELDGKQWSADTVDRIAEIMRRAGFKIEEPQGDWGISK